MSTKEMITSVTFNNGVKCPIIGLGTYKSVSEDGQAVKDAIDAGYRHFDCALCYENEKEVGAAINEKIKEGVVKREDLFVVSKLWNTYHKPERVAVGFKETLSNLNLDYLDLYLIHWPTGFKESDEFFPLNQSGKAISDDSSHLDTWRAMEKLLDTGLVKSIGISNFNVAQVESLLKIAKVIPVVNQIECHPYLTQKKLKSFCESKGIKITAYRPLGAGYTPNILEDATVNELATKHGKSAAQILLRYHVQVGNAVIPKSANKSRILSNIYIFDFELTQDEITTLEGLNRNLRFCPFECATLHKDYPFNADE